MFAEVIVNSSVSDLNRTFDYHVPDGLDVSVGMRVCVPFGLRKTTEIGYVVNLKETSEYSCKDLISVEDKVFDEDKLDLAKWMSHKYFCNLADTLKLLVPPGTGHNINKVKEKQEKWVMLNGDVDISSIKSDKQKRIINFLIDNGEMPVSELLMFSDTTRAVLSTLEKNGIVKVFTVEINRNPFAYKEVEITNNKFINDLSDLSVTVISETNYYNDYAIKIANPAISST